MDDHSADVIARAVTDRMNVPLLDALRDRLSDDEYRAVLALALDQIESLKDCPLDRRLTAMALAAAAAMWAEASRQVDEVIGGPGAGSHN